MADALGTCIKGYNKKNAATVQPDTYTPLVLKENNMGKSPLNYFIIRISTTTGIRKDHAPWLLNSTLNDFFWVRTSLILLYSRSNKGKVHFSTLNLHMSLIFNLKLQNWIQDILYRNLTNLALQLVFYFIKIIKI